jgi:hypothetical protein
MQLSTTGYRPRLDAMRLTGRYSARSTSAYNTVHETALDPRDINARTTLWPVDPSGALEYRVEARFYRLSDELSVL